MPTKFITLTGPSGVGKTTVMRKLLMLDGYGRKTFHTVPSITTRSKRQDDVPGEYLYVGESGFDLFEKKDAFLWTTEVLGVRYGTLKSTLAINTSSYQILIMILTPDRVPNLRQFAREKFKEEVVRSFFITASDEELLERLRGRGYSEKKAELAVEACQNWIEEAVRMDCFDEFLENSTEHIPAATVTRKILESLGDFKEGDVD